MQNCFKCSEEGINATQFSVVSKTYFKLKDINDILCYRHWHQLKRPPYDIKNDYFEVIKYLSIINKQQKNNK